MHGVRYLLQCVLQTRWSLIVELQLLLHCGEPGLALLESVLMANVFLQLPVQTLVHLLNNVSKTITNFKS